MSAGLEGVRLAKRVAAQQICSRREAEELIASGCVQVQGETVTDPARRVPDNLSVQVVHASVAGAVTVLLHKPAGVSAAQALRQAWPALALGPQPSVGLKECCPLPDAASGLSVWSDERPTVRRLQDPERPLELEWLLSLPVAESVAPLARLRAAGLRVSLSHERDGAGQWRLVGKGPAALHPLAVLDIGQWPEGWTLRRQRLGRLGLSPLALGQARLRRDFEKF